MDQTTCPVCGTGIAQGADVCPACGFKLNGTTQRFEPVQANVATPAAFEAAPLPRATLRIVHGPQIETVFTLIDGPMKIGRNPQCSIFLNDMTVSRAHAVITPAGTGYEIRDTGSYNGVWVNNENIDVTQLHDGDVIQVGAFCLLYQE